jgi:hypothetical protein
MFKRSFKGGDKVRIPERYKQTVYVANETYFGSGTYGEPYALRGQVSPKVSTIIIGIGIQVQQNNVEIKFENNVKGVEHITQNSRFWIKKKPNELEEGADFTHTVAGRNASTHDWFVTVECESATGDFPIV